MKIIKSIIGLLSVICLISPAVMYGKCVLTPLVSPYASVPNGYFWEYTPQTSPHKIAKAYTFSTSSNKGFCVQAKDGTINVRIHGAGLGWLSFTHHTCEYHICSTSFQNRILSKSKH